ncbi:MAG: hypothetical protein NZM38_08540 [Cytophagales bacterium]|nr:hypothetical protein [Cytophagales bacterium]MDW8384806.1 hypothetical protein [Flammeovirgaceae bacterium]
MTTLEKIAIQNETGRIHAEIDIQTEDKLAIISFLGYQSLNDITNAYSKSFEILKPQGGAISRLLLDSTEMKGPFRYDGHWVDDEFLRPFTRIGIKYIALVVTARIFSELKNQEIFVAETPAKFFTNAGYARVWLHNKR